MNAKPHSCFIASLMNYSRLKKESAKLHGINEKKKQGKVKRGKMKKPPVFIGRGLFLIRTLDQYLRLFVFNLNGHWTVRFSLGSGLRTLDFYFVFNRYW